MENNTIKYGIARMQQACALNDKNTFDLYYKSMDKFSMIQCMFIALRHRHIDLAEHILNIVGHEQVTYILNMKYPRDFDLITKFKLNDRIDIIGLISDINKTPNLYKLVYVINQNNMIYSIRKRDINLVRICLNYLTFHGGSEWLDTILYSTNQRDTDFRNAIMALKKGRTRDRIIDGFLTN